MIPRKQTKNDAFSSNPFMMGYDRNIFERDEELGFRFPKGKLITADGFISLQAAIRNANTGSKVLLNMGDSSTSGWNSNKVHKNNRNTQAAFFTYKTYSQLIDEQSQLVVVNAGVPGYSSLQGKKYLEKLLKSFAVNGIKVDYATFYFGNNDSTYNQLEDKVRLEGKLPTPGNNGCRVSLEDYKRNLRSMIENSRDYSAEPVLIMPPVHYDWPPGIRSENDSGEFSAALAKLKDESVKKGLRGAIEHFERGEYKEALELDMVLPRIKENYRAALNEVARETRTPVIDVQNDIPPTDNSEYFADYCHPLEKANKLITEKFFGVTGEQMKTKRPNKIPMKWRILNGMVKLSEYLGIGGHKEQYDKTQPPGTIYTLY